MGGALNQIVSAEVQEFRAKVLKLQDVMLKVAEVEQFPEPPIEHHFAPSMYAREMFMPQGSVIIGRIHKHSHINVISKGIVEIAADGVATRYEAPITFVNNPMAKRVLHAITDVIMTTIHATELTDPEEILNEITLDSYDGDTK